MKKNNHAVAGPDGLVCTARLPLSSATLNWLADLIRGHMRRIGSRWWALPAGKIAWKLDADEVKDNREHAKDSAALANTQGGIIVTGVAENGTGGVATVVGVDDARVARALADRFRGIANSMVRPFIPAFTVYTLPLPAVPGRSAVVVQVPRSPESRTWCPGTRTVGTSRSGWARTRSGWASPRRRPRTRDG
ncbi:AlbA family DNA-binding domain-containing protein [Streptomyces sp. NPDC002845]